MCMKKKWKEWRKSASFVCVIKISEYKIYKKNYKKNFSTKVKKNLIIPQIHKQWLCYNITCIRVLIYIYFTQNDLIYILYMFCGFPYKEKPKTEKLEDARRAILNINLRFWSNLENLLFLTIYISYTNCKVFINLKRSRKIFQCNFSISEGKEYVTWIFSLDFIRRGCFKDLTYVRVHASRRTEPAAVRVLIDLICNNTYDLDS